MLILSSFPPPLLALLPGLQRYVMVCVVAFTLPSLSWAATSKDAGAMAAAIGIQTLPVAAVAIIVGAVAGAAAGSQLRAAFPVLTAKAGSTALWDPETLPPPPSARRGVQKRGRGTAKSKHSNAPVLEFTVQGSEATLFSTRSPLSAPLSSVPSKEVLVDRLVDSLPSSWDTFLRIYIRIKITQCGEEKWLASTQSRLKVILSSFTRQDAKKAATYVPLFIA
jgi:hypothetical protein